MIVGFPALAWMVFIGPRTSDVMRIRRDVMTVQATLDERVNDRICGGCRAIHLVPEWGERHGADIFTGRGG